MRILGSALLMSSCRVRAFEVIRARVLPTVVVVRVLGLGMWMTGNEAGLVSGQAFAFWGIS